MGSTSVFKRQKVTIITDNSWLLKSDFLCIYIRCKSINLMQFRNLSSNVNDLGVGEKIVWMAGNKTLNFVRRVEKHVVNNFCIIKFVMGYLSLRVCIKMYSLMLNSLKFLNKGKLRWLCWLTWKDIKNGFISFFATSYKKL